MRPSPKCIDIGFDAMTTQLIRACATERRIRQRADDTRAMTELMQRHRNICFGATDVSVEAWRLQQQLLAGGRQAQQDLTEANDGRFHASRVFPRYDNVDYDTGKASLARDCRRIMPRFGCCAKTKEGVLPAAGVLC